MAVYDVGLADRIRAKGVRVIEVAGWQTRSAGSYGPRGAVHHHAAGSASGATPSLATVIYGRPGLSGPLAQVLQSREPDGRDIAYVIAAGRANHAGAGGWRGLSGNSSVGGLEVEHTGTGTVPAGRHEISARILAALVEAPGSPRDAGLVCQHFEWAPTRKVDFRSLAPYSPAWIRQRVAYWIGRTAAEEDDVTPQDHAQIKAVVHAEARALFEDVREDFQRLGQFLAAGVTNQVFDPRTQTWIAQATTLPKVTAALASLGGVDETELAAALAPLITSQMRTLSDSDLTAVADAVADEQHRRSAE